MCKFVEYYLLYNRLKDKRPKMENFGTFILYMVMNNSLLQ